MQAAAQVNSAWPTREEGEKSVPLSLADLRRNLLYQLSRWDAASQPEARRAVFVENDKK